MRKPRVPIYFLVLFQTTYIPMSSKKNTYSVMCRLLEIEIKLNKHNLQSSIIVVSYIPHHRVRYFSRKDVFPFRKMKFLFLFFFFFFASLLFFIKQGLGELCILFGIKCETFKVLTRQLHLFSMKIM